MSFIIKKLAPGDIDFAKQLFWFFQADDGIANPLIPSDKYITGLLLRNDFHVIAALLNGILIGGVTGYELDMYKEEIREMFLYEIAVKPEYRKMGVAKSLIGYLKEICMERGIKEMYVGTSTDNEPALKLYKSTGGEADPNIAWFVYSLTRK